VVAAPSPSLDHEGVSTLAAQLADLVTDSPVLASDISFVNQDIDLYNLQVDVAHFPRTDHGMSLLQDCPLHVLGIRRLLALNERRSGIFVCVDAAGPFDDPAAAEAPP
jgi:hypothetical protein